VGAPFVQIGRMTSAVRDIITSLSGFVIEAFGHESGNILRALRFGPAERSMNDDGG
jgi:hypothetical protein